MATEVGARGEGARRHCCGHLEPKYTPSLPLCQCNFRPIDFALFLRSVVIEGAYVDAEVGARGYRRYLQARGFIFIMSTMADMEPLMLLSEAASLVEAWRSLLTARFYELQGPRNLQSWPRHVAAAWCETKLNHSCDAVRSLATNDKLRRGGRQGIESLGHCDRPCLGALSHATVPHSSRESRASGPSSSARAGCGGGTGPLAAWRNMPRGGRLPLPWHHGVGRFRGSDVAFV